MKIAILNYTGCFIDIVSVPKDAEENINNDKLSVDTFLTDLGYDIGNCQWMLSDRDDIPVFMYNEEEPVIVL